MKFVTRSGWGARAPRAVSRNIRPRGVAVHYTGTRNGWPFGHDRCASKVRAIQRYHQDKRGWADIAYSLIVCPHGYVFEGRGAGVRSAANGTNSANTAYYAVCYLGGEGEPFTRDGRLGVRDGVDYLRRRGAGHEVIGHRDVRSTACPGEEIYGWVRRGCPVEKREPEPERPPATDGTEAQKMPFVKLGDEGDNVRRVQALLIALRHDLSQEGGVDGVFGPGTEREVKQFQEARGLPANGIVDGDDWAWLLGLN